jgi:geranylgeranyl transferase type-1 subunit beta
MGLKLMSIRLTMAVFQRALLMKLMVHTLLISETIFSKYCTAGYTYCAVASLSLLNRLPDPSEAFAPTSSTMENASNPTSPGLTNLPATVRWLVSRQIAYNDEDEGNDEESCDALPEQDQRDALAGIHKEPADSLSLDELLLHETQFVGFNGRCNKRADTCYAFWVGASLDVRMLCRLISHATY